MKLKLTFIMLFIPLVAFANINDQSSPMDISKLPQPDSGVKIVPVSRTNFTENENREFAHRLQEIKTKGYVELDTEEPKKLLKMNYYGKLQIANSKKINDPKDSHLKRTIADVHLAFPFNGIPMLQKSNIIGYSAMGVWIDNKGWTGIKMFFTNKLGTCSYSLNNRYLSHGAVQIGEDAVRYDVNKKPNTLYVEGDANSGYIYNISWFDDTYSKELECANMNYSANITKELIAYANVIEK